MIVTVLVVLIIGLRCVVGRTISRSSCGFEVVAKSSIELHLAVAIETRLHLCASSSGAI